MIVRTESTVLMPEFLSLRVREFREATPPKEFPIRGKSVQELVEPLLQQRGWRSPCPELFELLAEEMPGLLLRLLREPYLNAVALSQAAEAAGKIRSPREAIPALRALLEHREPIVREGAVDGLARFVDQLEVIEALKSAREAERSDGVRTAIDDALYTAVD